jgi:hypothetical protein
MGSTSYQSIVNMQNGMKVGSGTTITKVLKGTVAVDLASLATVTAADKDITIAGAAVGDTVIIQPPAADMTAGLLVCQAWVAATDTVTVRVYNASGSTIDEASATWVYTLIRS